MEFIQQLTNITDKDGKVITLFDGAITLSQAILGVLTFLVVLFVLRTAKKLIRNIIGVAIACVFLVYFNIVSPTQLKDVGSQLTHQGMKAYTQFSKTSKNIKLEKDTIKIKLNKKWVDIKEIKSFSLGKNNKLTIVTKDGSYVIEDNTVLELLKTFK